MKVNVKLFGLLRQRVDGSRSRDGIDLELPQQTVVRNLLDLLNLREADKVAVIADGRIQREDCPIQDGSKISIFSLIAGG